WIHFWKTGLFALTRNHSGDQRDYFDQIRFFLRGRRSAWSSIINTAQRDGKSVLEWWIHEIAMQIQEEASEVMIHNNVKICIQLLEDPDLEARHYEQACALLSTRPINILERILAAYRDRLVIGRFTPTQYQHLRALVHQHPQGRQLWSHFLNDTDNENTTLLRTVLYRLSRETLLTDTVMMARWRALLDDPDLMPETFEAAAQTMRGSPTMHQVFEAARRRRPAAQAYAAHTAVTTLRGDFNAFRNATRAQLEGLQIQMGELRQLVQRAVGHPGRGAGNCGPEHADA
ncbi:MAG: hypothetical protein B7X06_00185, partial [Verrucomicrobia bacterium 21-51-4]